MSTRERAPDPYRQDDELLGEASIRGEPCSLRVRIHVAQERYSHTDAREEIVPLPTKAGRRTYVHATPYLWERDLPLTVGLCPARGSDGAIGEVLNSEREGMRHVVVGNCQAWLYRPDRTLIIWEAYLHDRWRRPDPTADPALITLWRGFEQLLLERFSRVDRVATPAWEPQYDQALWQKFLGTLGFVRWNERAFGKGVRRP